MALLHLKAQDFRNLARVELRPGTGVNLIFGANGSGKTSLLEAIYYLGRGASFRTQKVQSLIRRGSEQLIVYGEIERGSGRVGVGLRRSAREFEVRVGGEKGRGLGEVAAMFPMLVINPDSHRLIEQGPKQRRQFLDWGVFHVEQEFHGIWLRYMRALRQRNAALRSSRPNAATAWDAELVTHGEALHVMRVAYLERLLPLIGGYVAPLAELGELTISYQPGWPTEVEFAQAIQSGLERDRAIGHTRYGPHRADLAIRLNAVAAEEAVSRGQQKLLVAGMRMAQAKLLGDTVGHPPTMLVDDLPAELDAEHRAALLALLVSLGGQLFITAIEPAQIELPATRQPISVFHVEHGALREVI